MKIQRILALTKKEMKKTVREPAVLFMIFLFPIIFVIAFGTAFGGTDGSSVVYDIGVVNTDAGSNTAHSQQFLNNLTATKILNLQMYADNQSAQSDLSQGKIQAVMFIPQDFSQSLASYQAAPNNPDQWTNASVSLYLDKGSLIATQAISPILQQGLLTLTRQGLPTQSSVSLSSATLVEVKTVSALDFIAPGMFTFASIFLIMMVGQSFAQDRENGMMKRIRITPTSSTEFIVSQVTSYMGIALIQAALVFALTYALGFHPAVGIPTYAFAFIMVLVFSVSNVGFGLITATIAKSPGAATGIAFLFVIPQMFLGTFIGASLSSAAQTAGQFVPSYYVTDALTSLFLRGASITSQAILFDLAILSISCIAILFAGIALYSKKFKI
jgi:ABC-2 type transport system permease protein